MKGQTASARGTQNRVFLLYFSHRTHIVSVHVYVCLCVRTYVRVCMCVCIRAGDAGGKTRRVEEVATSSGFASYCLPDMSVPCSHGRRKSLYFFKSLFSHGQVIVYKLL